MVATVNEVKKLEVELDRAGQNLSQVQQKYNEQEEAVSVSGGGGGGYDFPMITEMLHGVCFI